MLCVYINNFFSISPRCDVDFVLTLYPLAALKDSNRAERERVCTTLHTGYDT
jgi:hypothetical protein